MQAILDMTEREQLARELKDSEEKFRRLVETSLDGIVLHRDMKLLVRQPGLPGDVRLPGARSRCWAGRSWSLWTPSTARRCPAGWTQLQRGRVPGPGSLR